MFLIKNNFFSIKFLIFYLGYLNCKNYCLKEFFNINTFNYFYIFINKLFFFFLSFDLRRDFSNNNWVLRPLNSNILYFLLKNNNFYYIKLYKFYNYIFDHITFYYFIFFKNLYFFSIFLKKNYKLLNLNYTLNHKKQIYFININLIYNIFFFIFINF